MGQYFPVGFIKYVGLLLNRAAQKSVLLTDRLTILIVPFATLALWMTGAKMTDSIQETLLLGVAMTVVAVVILRLIAASYFVWKDDQAEKEALRFELSAPEREALAVMKHHTLDLRKRLSDRLGRLSAYACYPNSVLSQDKSFEAGFNDLVSEIDALVNQLSYDFPLRIAALRLRDYCLKLIHEQKTPGEHFWEQRRITFRLLHKQDQIADFMTLMDLEILLEDAGLITSQDEDSIEELKRLIRRLGPLYYDKKIQKEIRDTLRRGEPINPASFRERQSPEDTEAKTQP